MSQKSLNEIELPEDKCYGCGFSNSQGLGIKVDPLPEGADELTATLVVPEHGTGLPGVVHGGILYTALDCLAGWIKLILMPKIKMFPATKTATINYHKPGVPGRPITLKGRITKGFTGPRDPIVIHTEAYDEAGDLLVDGDYTMALFPPEFMKQVAGIDELPEHYRKRFES